MRLNFRKLLEIMALVLMTAIVLQGCTRKDNKCMPLTSTSKKAKELAWEGQAILADGFNAKAIELFKQALALDSNFVAANLWYGQNAASNSVVRRPYFARAERNIGNVPVAEQHLVRSYLASDMGDRETAINELKEIVKLYPEDKYMLRLIAVRYNTYGKYEDALEYAKKSYQADTNFSTIVNYHGTILTAMGKNDEAEKWYKKAIAMKPDVPLYYNSYGQLLRSTGRIEEALGMHKKAAGIGSDFLSFGYLGNCYIAMGDYVQARENFSKAFDLSVTDAQKNGWLLNAASTHLFEGKLDEGLTAIDKCIDFEKKSGGMNTQIIDNTYYKALCCLFYKDMANTAKYYDEGENLINTLNLTEKDLTSYRKNAIFYRGWLQALTGKTAEAQKSLDEFKKSMKDETELNSMKSALNTFEGIVAFSKKKWPDAAKMLEAANLPVPRYYAGLAYMNAGDKAKAIDMFTIIANNKMVGTQLSMVKLAAIKKLDELNKE